MSWLKRRLPTKRWKRICLYLASILLILLAVDILLTQHRRHIVIAHDTTRFTEPLNAAGFPDYITVANMQASEGVTAENNAAELLSEVLGSKQKYDAPSEWLTKNRARLGIPEQQVPPAIRSYESWDEEHPPADKELASKESDEMLKQPWSAADHLRWIAYLRDQRTALDKAHLALEKPRYFVPYHAGSSERLLVALLPQLGPAGALRRALLADAMRCLGEKDFAGFRRDVNDTLKLARALDQRLFLIETLVAVATESAALQAVQRAAAMPAMLTSDQAQMLLQDMNSLRPLQGVGRSIDIGERAMMLDVVCAAATYGGGTTLGDNSNGFAAWMNKTALPLNYNLILREANNFYDRSAKAFEQPTYHQQRTAVKAVLEDLQARNAVSTAKKMLHPSQSFCDILLNILAPSFDRTVQYAEAARMEMQLARVALGLRLHQLENGAFPDSLGAVAPKYLKEIPRDSFADTPLKYRKEGSGYVLYSVGRDEVDDHGAEKIPGSKTWDMVVKAAG